MTERTVTIKLNLQDEIGNRLNEIKQQRDALAKTANVSMDLKLNSQIQDQVRAVQASMAKAHQAALDSFKGSRAALKDVGTLGGTIASQAVVPLIQYQKVWAATAQASKAFTSSATQALKGVSAEFQKQGDLAKFWSSSGFLNQGLVAISNALRNMLSGSGAGLTAWLQNAAKGIEQYRTAMVGASAAMLGFSLSAARSYKVDLNHQKSVLGHLEGKISDHEMPDVKEWLGQASKDDWSQGQTARLEVYKNVLNKTGLRGEAARKTTENIEKAWFANQEDLKEHGFTSAQDLIQTATTKTLRGETADQLDAIFGKGFSKKSVNSRIHIMDQIGDKTDIESALADRPEEILAKRLAASTSAIGQTVVPVLNTILDAFLKISDAIAKIPGLNSIIGWGTVLTAAAAAGLAMTSILGGMVSNLMVLRTTLAGSTLVEYAHTAAMWLGSAAAAARAAVTGVLTTVTGLFTGEVTLSSIVMAGWNAIMAAGAVVAGIFNLSMLPIIAVMGAAALLIGLVAYKSGLLQTVLKSLSNINLGRIFKDLRMGDLSKAWNDLAKGFKAPQTRFESWTPRFHSQPP